MKTHAYRTLRILCSVLILILIATNAACLVYAGYHYETLSIESAVLLNSRYSLKSFAKVLIYLNLFFALLSSYALNLGYSFLMSMSVWTAVGAEIVGVYSVIHFREKGPNPLITRLNYGISHVPELVFRLSDYSSCTDPEEAQSYFIREFTALKSYFVVAEAISLVAVSIIATGLLVGQHMEREEETPATPVIVSTVAGLSTAESLRKKLLVSNQI